MMAPSRAGKFKLNKRTVGHIMKRDPGLIRAVDNAGEKVAKKAGPTATVETYTTDRHVAGVVVTALAQARDGAATRAAQQVSSESRGDRRLAAGIRSRAQWRYLHANDPSKAAQAVKVSPRYSSLPERAKK